MKDLITSTKNYTNELTKEMDKYLLSHKSNLNTYIHDEAFGNMYIVRYPGLSITRILLDENKVIKDINFYRDLNGIMKIYKDSIIECFDKYKGMRLVFN